MKRILLIANIVLAAAVVALYVLFFTNQPNKNNDQIFSGAASELPSGAIVYLQLDTLLNGLDLFHALRTDFEAKVKVVNDDLTKQGRAWERDAADFTDKIQKGLLTRSQGETMQAQLEARQRELQQYSQQKEMELAEEEQVMLNNVINEIQTYLIIYNQEHNFSLIFTTSGAPGTIVNGDPSLNITKDVMTGLNSKYASQRNARR